MARPSTSSKTPSSRRSSRRSEPRCLFFLIAFLVLAFSSPGQFKFLLRGLLGFLDETMKHYDLPSEMMNNTRAIRCGRRERNSQIPLPILSTKGFPTGHPYCTVRRSSPIACRSSTGKLLSHSRTGSLPLSVLKKTTLSGRSSFIPGIMVPILVRLSICPIADSMERGRESGDVSPQSKMA